MKWKYIQAYLSSVNAGLAVFHYSTLPIMSSLNVFGAVLCGFAAVFAALEKEEGNG